MGKFRTWTLFLEPIRTSYIASWARTKKAHRQQRVITPSIICILCIIYLIAFAHNYLKRGYTHKVSLLDSLRTFTRLKYNPEACVICKLDTLACVTQSLSCVLRSSMRILHAQMCILHASRYILHLSRSMLHAQRSL